MRTMGAAKAKAQFLAVVDEVAHKREPVTVTKNGRAMAQIVPLPMEEEDSLAIYRIGGVTILGDISQWANNPDDWEYD